jgi:hypothetical protein
MEFVITGSHGETISFKDHSKTEYLMTMSCPLTSGGKGQHTLVITKDQFKRLAKAS